jgi:ABC-type transport system substrate-binding protein
MVKFRLLAVFSVLLGMTLAAAGPGATMLVYGKAKDARVLDPGLIDEGNSSVVACQIFESLLRYKPGTMEVEPCLAESLPTVAKDGLALTFKLRKGVHFQDGTPLNADAVVFSLKRQNDKNHPFNRFGPWNHWVTKGWSATAKKPGIIRDIVKVDDSTVKVLLSTPDSTVLYKFALYFTSIVSPSAAQKYQADFRKNPVGTGPFQFVKWQKDDQIVLKRFDGYWGPKARLPGIIFKVLPDEQGRILALKRGEADIIEQPAPSGLATLEADPGIKIQQGNFLSIGYLCLNCESGPFVHKQLRQAFNHAVNRQEILKTVYGKMGVAEKLPLPSLLWGYDKSIPDYDYNPEKARALVKASGVPQPIKINLVYYPGYRPYNPSGQKVAEIVQAQLKAVGFDARIQTYESGTYWDNVNAGKFDVCGDGWSGEADPDDFLYGLFTEGVENTGRWHNPAYVDLVTRAKVASGRAARSRLYAQAERILMDDAPVLVLARGLAFQPMRKRVQGYTIYPNGKIYLAGVWLDK